MKARLEVARKYAEANKTSNDNQQKSSNYNQNNNYNQNRHHQKHKGNHHHHRREGHINEVDYEQAKMLKRNFHGDEYDNFGNGSESIVCLLVYLKLFSKCLLIHLYF